MGFGVEASGWDGAHTVTIFASRSQRRSTASGFTSGTFSIVTARAHTLSSTRFSPPCMVVIRRLIAAVRNSACKVRKQSIRWARGKDRKSVEKGKRGSVRVDLGGRRIIKKKKKRKN